MLAKAKQSDTAKLLAIVLHQIESYEKVLDSLELKKAELISKMHESHPFSDVVRLNRQTTVSIETCTVNLNAIKKDENGHSLEGLLKLACLQHDRLSLLKIDEQVLQRIHPELLPIPIGELIKSIETHSVSYRINHE